MEGGIIMREENYFKIKLRNAKDTLVMAERSLESLDIQINLLKVRFDHDKKVYDDQAIHMQNIVKSMEKRIPELEKKIEKGYTTIDMKTGKAFKSFKAKQIGLLQDQIKETKERQKAHAEAYKQKLALKEKNRSKLSDAELDIVIAEEVRESMQPADELKANREKEKERLEKKAEYYREELAKLKVPKKAPIKTIKAVVNDILEEAEDKIIEVLEPLPAELEDVLGLDDETIGSTEAPIEVIVAEKLEIANEFRNVADLMDGETKELQWLTAKRPDWIEQFELEEGGKAVWQGRITNGFKLWCEAKGYKIGG